MRPLRLAARVPARRHLRRDVLSLAAAMALSACTPGLRAGGALRVEQMSAAATSQQQLRADARAVVSLRGDAGTVALSVAPTALRPLGVGAEPRTILHTELTAAGDSRDRLQPQLTLAAARGQTRSVELVGDALDPRVALSPVNTERVAATASLRVRARASRELSLRAELSRDGGAGTDATLLPQLQRAALALERRRTLRPGRELRLRASGASLQRQQDAPWNSLHADAEWTAAIRRHDQLSLGVGLVQGLDSARADLRLALGWRHSARRGDLGWEARVEQAPELDRLDGRLRTRRRAGLSLESVRVSGVSIRGTLQGLADARGADARRGLSGELSMRQPLSSRAALEADVAQVLLWEGQATRRAETRAAVGIRIPLR